MRLKCEASALLKIPRDIKLHYMATLSQTCYFAFANSVPGFDGTEDDKLALI